MAEGLSCTASLSLAIEVIAAPVLHPAPAVHCAGQVDLGLHARPASGSVAEC